MPGLSRLTRQHLENLIRRMPNASLAELARRTGHSKKAIEKFCQLNGIEVAGEAPVNQEPTVIKVTATVSDPSAGRWVEPLPPIPLLPADELRWAIETFRSLGPGLPDKYATWGPLGVFVWYRDAFWAQLDELGKLEDKVKSLGRAAQYPEGTASRAKSPGTRNREGPVRSTDSSRKVATCRMSATAAVRPSRTTRARTRSSKCS